MVKDPELDRLKEEQDRTFEKQQRAYQDLKSTGDRRGKIKEELDVSWQKVQTAREAMDGAYRENQRNWDYYKSQREIISRQIDCAKSKADSLHSQMAAAFDRASNAYNCGDRSSAPGYAAEGHRYKAELQTANAEVKSLITKVKSLPRPNDSFRSYQEIFKSYKAKHKVIQDRYAIAKRDNELAREQFDQARQDHQQAKRAFQDRLARVKAERASNEAKNRSMLMVVDPEVAFMNGKQVKFKPRNDGSGKIDIYFGGMLDSDGYGHGHIVVDRDSNVIYMRQQFKDKKDPSQIDIDERRGITNI